jgi:GTP pyrophosphokinase
MNEIAERGFAAHWKYKGVTGQPDVYERWLDSVREILEDPNSDAVEFLGNFKSNSLFHEEVYVYTPIGEMRVLPKGATALDFAFSIHTDIGYHCSAIKVDKRLVPLSYVLQNGDRIEVVTNKNQKPSEDWLKFVTTGKAKSKIRSSMKEERRKVGELGHEALDRKFRNMRVDHTEQAVETLVKHYRLSSPTDLYFAIAMEQITVGEIFKKFHVEHGVLVENPVVTAAPAQPSPAEQPHRERKNKIQTRLLINGEPGEQYDYTLATCCNPVQGDQIFAYLTANAGLKIHRVNCPNAANLMVNYGYRIMKAEWVVTDNTTFVTKLRITGIDDGPGVIERLTHNISSLLGLNIRSLNIEGEDGYFEAELSIVVRNTDQLNQAVYALKNLSNVSTVTRLA